MESSSLFKSCPLTILVPYLMDMCNIHVCVYVLEKVKEMNAKLNEEEDGRLNEVQFMFLIIHKATESKTYM